MKRHADLFGLYSDMPPAKPKEAKPVTDVFSGLPPPKKAREGGEPSVPTVAAAETPPAVPAEEEEEDCFGLGALIKVKKPKEEKKEITPVKSPATKLKEGLAKLQVILRNDKKFNKASGILKKMVENHLDGDSAMMFVGALNSAMYRPDRAQDPALRKAFIELFKAISDRKECFPKEMQATVDNWCMRAVVVNELYTDDTYQFARAAKTLTTAVTALSATPQDEAGLEHVAALVAGLIAAYSYFKNLWAKTPVETLMKAAVERRQFFDDKQRIAVEKMWTTVKARNVSALATSMNAADKSMFKDDHRQF